MRMSRRWLLALPLLVFAGLLWLMAGNLGRPQQQVIESRMVGKPLPAFTLAGVGVGPGLSRADLSGRGPVLVNLFASWCLPCAVEAPQLEALRRSGARIYGVAVRDTPADVAAFLARHGDPYTRIGADTDGRMMLSLGASGVPETYVVDSAGVIRHQHLGDIRAEHVPRLLDELEKAR